MRKSHGVIVLIVLLMFTCFPVTAESTTSGSVELIVSTAKDLKVEADYTIKTPMLTGEGVLTQQNNLKLKGLVGISPVAATFSADAILTPLAVLELSTGVSVATGWNLSATLLGLQIMYNGALPKQAIPFGGAYYNGRVGAAFQFDTAAVIPGEWTSVVIRTYHELNYQGLTSAATPDLWEFELGGFRKNGVNYRAEYLVGYQMPIILNMVAFMFETTTFNTFDNHGNEVLYDMSFIGNLNFIDNLNLTIVCQFTTKPSVSSTYPKLREPWRFSRVVAMLKYSF